MVSARPMLCISNYEVKQNMVIKEGHDNYCLNVHTFFHCLNKSYSPIAWKTK